MPQTTRRASATWRGSGPEEDAAYREEVLAQHVPDPSDPWMLWETAMLPSFSRIFPSPHPSSSQATGGWTGNNASAAANNAVATATATASGGTEEEEDDDDDGSDDGERDDIARGGAGKGEGQGSNGSKKEIVAGLGTNSTTTKTVASFEEILVQVIDRK